MTVFLRELRQNPFLFLTDMERAPERGYLAEDLWTPRKSLMVLSCLREAGGYPEHFIYRSVRHSHEQDTPIPRTVCFATIYNGRNDSRLENTVCMLVKTLPVYCSCDPKTTIQAYMTELSEQILSSMANDIFPFSDICAKYGINSDLVFCISGRA